MSRKTTSAHTSGAVGVTTHINRIRKEIQMFVKEGNNWSDIGIHFVAEEEDLTRLHALIRGPEDTPYMNGFFYFLVNIGSDYPSKPPKITIQTTSGGTVRFNPNLYNNGKVCLSILGTWSGPKWTPVLTVMSALKSIQSLMSAKPYHNEPGFEEQSLGGRHEKQSKDYNEVIAHETIRVAVLDMLADTGVDSRNMPPELKNLMISYFKSHFQYYEQFVASKQGLNGKTMTDPFGSLNTRSPGQRQFQYKHLFNRLNELKQRLDSTNGQTVDASASRAIEGSISGPSTSRAAPVRRPLNDIADQVIDKKRKKQKSDKPEIEVICLD